MPIRRARGWILGTGNVISRLWPSRVLGSDVARSTNPNHLSGKHEREPAPEHQEVPAHHQKPPKTKFQNRVDLKQLIRIDGGGEPRGKLSQPWVDPDDDHVAHGGEKSNPMLPHSVSPAQTTRNSFEEMRPDTSWLDCTVMAQSRSYGTWQ
jgi:hypothetical protein